MEIKDIAKKLELSGLACPKCKTEKIIYLYKYDYEEVLCLECRVNWHIVEGFTLTQGQVDAKVDQILRARKIR